MDDVIGQREWINLALHTGRQCTATSKQTGERCKRAPIVGGFVCEIHGGKIPGVRKAARERLLAMVDPALDALLRVLKTHGPPCEHCGRSDGDRDPVVVRAAQLVLDRTGFHPTLQVTSTPSPVHEELSQLSLSELADRAETYARHARALADAEAAHLLPAADGFVIPEEDESAVTDAAIQHPTGAIHDGKDTAQKSTDEDAGDK
jgi:hypothetical protein